LTRKNAQGVKRIPDDFDNEFQIDVKLFTVLYADDTVLMSESAEELQSEFNNFLRILLKKVNLEVNRNKSKVMDLSKGMLPMNLKFKMNGIGNSK
jgi:hypothetical protein